MNFAFARSAALALSVDAFAFSAMAEATHLRPATAETAADSRQRLALAEEQKTIVEEISEMSCLVAMDVGRAKYAAMIDELAVRFDGVANALRVGDEAFGVTGEEHASRVIKALNATDELWGPFKAAAAKMKQNPDGAGDDLKELLFEGDVALLDVLSDLVVAVETAYANPADLLLGDAVTIDIATRQEVLTQTVGKDMCLVALGWRADKHRETLGEAVQTFEATQTALIDGMPAVGLKPAPTPEIKAALEGVSASWAALRPEIDATVGGGALEPAALGAFIERNLALLKEIEAAVALYKAL